MKEMYDAGQYHYPLYHEDMDVCHITEPRVIYLLLLVSTEPRVTWESTLAISWEVLWENAFVSLLRNPTSDYLGDLLHIPYLNL